MRKRWKELMRPRQLASQKRTHATQAYKTSRSKWRAANRKRMSDTAKRGYRKMQQDGRYERHLQRIKGLAYRKWNDIVQDVKRSGKELTITREEAYAIFKMPCAYCGTTIDHRGIDRIDNNKGYEPGNVAPSCWTCNRIKGSHTIGYFHTITARVDAYDRTGVEPHTDEQNVKDIKYALVNYRHNAKRSGRSFNLDKARVRELIEGACNYCGIYPANGIDRMDNAQGYELWNTVSCCWPCNRAKRELGVDEFIAKCRAITQHQSSAETK
jgi:5-methylcytosine-specific restriction endonuclease McrA